jgi:hypothetical protein
VDGLWRLIVSTAVTTTAATIAIAMMALTAVTTMGEPAPPSIHRIAVKIFYRNANESSQLASSISNLARLLQRCCTV